MAFVGNDPLIVEVKSGMTYAELLRKVGTDPEFKNLGEKVVKTRRTQKGEMLSELEKNPAIKSTTFKILVEKSLGEQIKVRALSQETVIECKDLDEITAEDELSRVLKGHRGLGDAPMTIQLKKAYGGNLLESSRVKVGWSVCSLRLVPRVPKELERCYKCMGFGHQAMNSKGPDRDLICAGNAGRRVILQETAQSN